MSNLYISKAKPNPAGKDRYAVDIPNRQLAGEWVDFVNNSSRGISLDSIVLYHMAYTASHPNGEWAKVMDFSGVLQPNEVVRVHSGGKVDLSVLNPVDIAGATYHLFTGKGYVWNNSKPDTAGLWNKSTEQWIDKASYTAYSPEGKILVRVGNNLI
jgi:hypothetical protein